MTRSGRLLARRLSYPVFWGAVAALGYFLVSASWMRWMDPQIDFGREVYLPWQILEGKHLGRDFVHPYGPLSDYFNTGLSAVCGPSRPSPRTPSAIENRPLPLPPSRLR